MEEQLPATPWLHGLNARRMYTLLYILCLMICGAAHSQPTMVSEISKTSKNFTSLNGRLYYSVGDSLFSATSSSAPTLVKKTGQPILRIYSLSLGTSFFFVTQNGTGQSLWRTDGTTANTVQVFTQTSITPLLVYHSQLFMKVTSSSTGAELWRLDGSFSAGIVKDINPGSASGFSGTSLTIHNDRLHFFASTGGIADLWKSDGTTAGTVMAVNLDDTDYYNPSGFYGLTSTGALLFFTRSYEAGDYGDRIGELWRSDGTQAGTSLVQATSAYIYNDYTHLTPFNGKLYFFHSSYDPLYVYFSVSDGTAAGTRHIEQVTIDGYPRELINAETFLLYYADSQGFITPIKKSDGTTSTVVHSFSYYYQGSQESISLKYTDGRAFFVDDVDAYEGTEKPRSSQLWQADLASGVTRPVQDIWNIPLTNSGNIVPSGSNIFFTRFISNRMTLWFYNPNTPPTPSLCENVGFIEREKWANITGYGVSTIPVNTQPTSINVLPSFATKQNDGDNYGARVRGYICPPQTGNYVFYISSDDNSELWLSTDDDPANKKLIASSKWTNYNEWTKYPSQQSAAIPLLAGSNYYIEALHKEATGGDHLSVGWRLPNGSLERPIPGMRLIPFKRNNAPNVYILQPSDGQIFTAPATVNIEASAWDPDGSVTKVAFYVGNTLLTEDATSPYTYSWQNVPAGTYSIEARATDNQGFVKSDFQTITVSPGCSGAGSIYQELWVNVPSVIDVGSFNWNYYPPNGGNRIFYAFETDQFYSNNYASRMRGWICVPQTGNYTFWISSDDGSELYLSTDESDANRRLIASVNGYTPFRNYDKYSSQKSTQIYLEAGHKYYIEARHRERTGNDFVSVGWQLPDGTLERPIAGTRLIPIVPTPNEPPSITITSPQPNQNFTSPASIRLAADVTDPDGVQEVKFVVLYGSTSTTLATFTSAPYEYQWNNVPSGSYQLLVEARDTRQAGTSKSVFFSVDKTTCSGTGKIVREIWTGITGTSVSSIPVNSTPNATVELTSFATPNYYGNDYGSRIRGYVCAPATGVYKFYISSDDNSELWLSDNDDPAAKKKIAYVIGATAVNQWNKYSSQASASLTLVQGQRYYIEVLHKEGTGADHVEVGWDLPSGPSEKPIPGNRLIPFEDAATMAATVDNSLSVAEENSTMSVFPNPLGSDRKLTVAIPSNLSGDAHIDIVSVAGAVLQQENVVGTAQEVTIDLLPSIGTGLYIVELRSNKRRWITKLQIR